MSDDLEKLEADLEGGDAEPEGSSPSAQLPRTQFLEAAEMWKSGRYTLPEIAQKFEVNPRSLQRRFERNGIKRGESAGEIVEATKEAIKSQAEINVERIQQTKEQHYTWSEALAKLAMSTIVNAQRQQRPLAAVEADLKSIGRAMKVIADARAERYTVLGLDKEDGEVDELPELLVSVLTEEQIAQIRSEMQPQDVDLEGLDTDDVEVLS